MKIKDLQQFIGIINFYHRFLPNIAASLKPLYKEIAVADSIKSEINWTQELTQAFEEVRTSLVRATMLVHPDPNAVVNLTTDASDIAVGAVIEQCVGGIWQPLAFFSRKLRDLEIKYSTYDKEMLAIKLALRHFRHHLEGRSFIIYTDHKPLTFALSRKRPSWTARQQRTLAEISEYSTEIRHISGKANPVADALSRTFVNALRSSIDYEELAIEQEKDPETIAARTSITELQWTDIAIGNGSRTLLCDTSQGNPRPYIPRAWRRRVFESIHNLSHPSIRSTVKLVTDKFVWHGLTKQIREWARCCLSCQKAKIHKHIKAPLSEFKVPQTRFAHINVDIVGPLPVSQGYTYLFTIVDRFTRWLEAYPLPKIDAISCARAIVAWIARYGVPADITSDHGRQFTSQLWKELGNLYGAKMHHTTSYHPQSNGLVERFHRHLKSALKAVLTEQGITWMDQLPWIMLGIRTAPKEDLRASSAELVYGSPLTVPADLISTKVTPTITSEDFLRCLRSRVAQLIPLPMSRHGKVTTHTPLKLNDSHYVFIRRGATDNTLQAPYTGPYKVLEYGTKTLLLEYGGKPERISVDRLKPAHVDRNSPV